MSTRGYDQNTKIPGVEEYRELRAICGLSPKSKTAATMGLPNTLFATTIRDQEKLIAMGRVIGDGGCNFEVVDVAVHPEYQQQGLGGLIMDSIMSYLNEKAPKSAYVSLIADYHSPALYSKFGFRPTTPKSIGMAFRVK